MDLRTYLIVRPREDQRVVVNMSTVDMSYEWTREDVMEMVTLNKSEMEQRKYYILYLVQFVFLRDTCASVGGSIYF